MEPLTLFVAVLSAILFIYITCFFLIADCDLSLTLNETFGYRVSVYEGKVIWITGAASGLGEAMAYELASVGAKLILTDRNARGLEQVKIKCLDVSKGKLNSADVLLLPFDLTDIDKHKAKFTEALEHFQKIDVLINNAGCLQIGPCAEVDINTEKDLFLINYFVAVNLSKVVLRHFLERKEGQLVFTASTGAKNGTPGLAAYCATKHAVRIFADTLRMKYNRQNVAVTIICPRFFVSKLENHAMGIEQGETFQVRRNSPAQMPTSPVAHLALVAAANKSYESWISYQPILFMVMMSQYAPDLARIMQLTIYTKQTVSHCVQGIYPKEFPAWRPLFRRS